MKQTLKSKNGTFTATFDAIAISVASGTVYEWHRREAFVLTLTAAEEPAQGEVYTYTINATSYYSDTYGALQIDLHDLVSTGVEIRLTLGADTLNIGVRVYEGISPEHVIMPIPAILKYLSGLSGLQIMPPSVVYVHKELSKHFALIVEGRGYVEEISGAVIYSDGTLAILRASNHTLNIQPKSGGVYAVSIGESVTEQQYKFQELESCEDVCVLRWHSESGITKQAVWRIKDVRKQVADMRDLSVLGNGYRQDKQEAVSFTAFIEGLNAYDYAYYSDVILSREVHAALFADDNITAESTLVAIDTADTVSPNGDAGEKYTLTINVKYKRYAL